MHAVRSWRCLNKCETRNGERTLRSGPEGRNGASTVARRDRAEALCFDRRFLFRVLAMGHSQFAELIGARGSNTPSTGVRNHRASRRRWRKTGFASDAAAA